MLARQYRLTHSADFAQVRDRGQCWSDRRIVLCRCANGLPHSRFGFIVSKRIGNAVVRNRARRLMREAVRLQRDLITSGWDVVLIARKGLAQADYWAAEQSLTHLLGQARLMSAAEGADETPGQYQST